MFSYIICRLRESLSSRISLCMHVMPSYRRMEEMTFFRRYPYLSQFFIVMVTKHHVRCVINLYLNKLLKTQTTYMSKSLMEKATFQVLEIFSNLPGLYYVYSLCSNFYILILIFVLHGQNIFMVKYDSICDSFRRSFFLSSHQSQIS